MRNIPFVSHQRAVGNLCQVLSEAAPNGEVFVAPVSVKFDDANFFQPDVLWVAADGACEITRDGLNGAPDLVVEVISPCTASTDRGHKFRTYQAHGVREYWIVEPELRFIEIWQLVNGNFVQHGVYEADETFPRRCSARRLRSPPFYRRRKGRRRFLQGENAHTYSVVVHLKRETPRRPMLEALGWGQGKPPARWLVSGQP